MVQELAAKDDEKDEIELGLHVFFVDVLTKQKSFGLENLDQKCWEYGAHCLQHLI